MLDILHHHIFLVVSSDHMLSIINLSPYLLMFRFVNDLGRGIN